MTDDSITEINFEYWSKLAATDPKKFEELRQLEISALIEKASNQGQRQRLRGLQWRIDQIRNQHKDAAMASCIAISELMWETFQHLSEVLHSQSENGLSKVTPSMKANVIPFPAKSDNLN